MKLFRVSLVTIALVVVVVMLFTLAANSAAQDSTTLTLDSAEVGVGQSSTLTARLTCGAPTCSGFSATLSFDPALLRVQSVSAGPFLGPDVFVAAKSIDNAAGSLTFSASAVQPPPAGADNVLFQVQLNGLAAGESPVEITDLRIAGPDGSELPASGQGTTVSVVETGQLPFFSPPTASWEIAFVSERDGNPEIYVMNADGTGLRRLTNNPALDNDPTWSPSGDRLAFFSDRDGTRAVYVMNPDGSAQQRLTSGTAADYRPTWSPDASQIAFVSERDGNPEIYVMNADGSSPRRLTNSPAIDTEPAWSPGGQRVLFVSDRDGAYSLYAVDAGTGSVQPMTDLLGANGNLPDWRPDAGRIAVTVSREGPANVYTMSPEGQNSTRITQQGDGLAAPAWSPDGNFLAFKSNRFGPDNLFVYDLNASALFRLTDNQAHDYEPDWRALGQPEPCIVSTTQDEIAVRVGPGPNRSVFTFMPVNRDFDVTGQYTDEDGERWFRLDKTQFEGAEVVNTLWVRARDVRATGDCAQVPTETPPPLIPGNGDGDGENGNGWSECGACDTCGYATEECVLSPEGECVWDPERCRYIPPPPTPDECIEGPNNPCYPEVELPPPATADGTDTAGN